MHHTTKLFVSICAVAALAVQAHAGIITPASATSATGNLSSRPIEEAINGNGLSSGGISGDILTETHNVNSGNGGEYWIGTKAGAALTFALPSASTVDTVHIWNYSRTGEEDRAIASFDISFSSDGSNFGTPINLSGFTRPSFPFDSSPINVQSVSFAQQTGMTHIRIDNIVNYGDPNYIGLSEIRFEGEEIPEPASLALLGLGGLMIARRRG